MKRIKYFGGLGLLILLVALLAGCGGGSGGGGGSDVDPATAIHFTMPSVYYSQDDIAINIPSGKTVKFYLLTKENYKKVNDDESGSVAIETDDNIFTKTTGSSDLQFTLPDSLDGQERYIYAVVILKGSFDLRGKTKEQLFTAVSSGDVLFGQAQDSDADGPKLVKLEKKGTVSPFIFNGITTESAVINFTLPDVYYDYANPDSGASANIPSGRTVKFYAFSDTDTEPLDADYIFPATTTRSGNLQFELPDSLENQTCQISAVVILSGSFELQGATQEQLVKAVKDKEVLYGKTEEVILTNGDTVNFKFVGAF